MVREWLAARGAALATIVASDGFARNAAINAAKEAANENDETRKRFEVMCRTVFAKFKACVTFPGVDAFRDEYKAIEIVYKTLQQGRADADISGIMREMRLIVDEAIAPRESGDDAREDAEPYDISRIEFERLKAEFARSKAKRTAVQNVRNIVEACLRTLLARNPLRTNFQQHFEKIVADYNSEKDQQTIEQTFEALLKFIEQMNEEEDRAAREGLDEESLAIYDLLRKPTLTKQEIARVKRVAQGLLEKLKVQVLRIDKWQEKEQAWDGVKQQIFDYLFADATGLPGVYTERRLPRAGTPSIVTFLKSIRRYPRRIMFGGPSDGRRFQAL